MGSPPHRRCSFKGISLPLNGSVCTGWEPASTTWETPASLTPQCSVSPTPRHLPTTYSQRSTAVPVSIRVMLFNVARLAAVFLQSLNVFPNPTYTHKVSSLGNDCNTTTVNLFLATSGWKSQWNESQRSWRRKNKNICYTQWSISDIYYCIVINKIHIQS